MDSNADDRLDRWAARTDLLLSVAAVAFIAAYAWPVLDPGITHELAGRVCRAVNVVTWIMFVLDYVVRLTLSSSRSQFVLHNLLDLASVALPVLRPLRLLRLVTVLKILNRRASSSLRGRVAVYIVGATVLTLFMAALAMLDAERGATGANITTFGDAVWWAITTMTTVGYGDQYPVTTTGRFVAGGLMIAGIALLGVVTATIASWLIERVAAVNEETEVATRHDLRELTLEVARLREMLQERNPAHDK